MPINDELSRKMQLIEASTFATTEELLRNFGLLERTHDDVLGGFMRQNPTPEQKKQIAQASEDVQKHKGVARKMLQLLIDETDLSTGAVSISLLYLCGILGASALTVDAAGMFAATLQKAVDDAIQSAMVKQVSALFNPTPENDGKVN